MEDWKVQYMRTFKELKLEKESKAALLNNIVGNTETS
jgi:hypothetical protein